MTVSCAPIMQRYEKALELTHAMLEAAQKSDWERLIALEQEREAIIDQLRELDRDPGRDASVRRRKRELIGDIMRCDEQVQVLTQDWMRELREVLGSIGAEQKLSRSCGP
jgi:flagellar protein FliT